MILTPDDIDKINEILEKSQTCSKCGLYNTELNVEEKFWTCPECYKINFNAAFDLKDFIMMTTTPAKTGKSSKRRQATEREQKKPSKPRSRKKSLDLVIASNFDVEKNTSKIQQQFFLYLQGTLGNFSMEKVRNPQVLFKYIPTLFRYYKIYRAFKAGSKTIYTIKDQGLLVWDLRENRLLYHRCVLEPVIEKKKILGIFVKKNRKYVFVDL